MPTEYCGTKTGGCIMKKLSALAVCLAAAFSFMGCGGSSSGENGEVIVYNWGEYLDPEAIDLFEE